MTTGYEPLYDDEIPERKLEGDRTEGTCTRHVRERTHSALRQFFVPRIKDLRRESRGRDSPYALRWGPTWYVVRVLFPFPNG